MKLGRIQLRDIGETPIARQKLTVCVACFKTAFLLTRLRLHLNSINNQGMKREEGTSEAETVISRGVEVESLEDLQKLFEAIQNDKQTKTFVYENIQFWKVNRRYQFSNTNELISYAPPISFETFVAAFKEFN